MKLSIRSDTVHNLTKVLQNNYESKLCIVFGNMQLKGFTQRISEWHYNCIETYITNTEHIECMDSVDYTPVQDIGFINHYHIFLTENIDTIDKIPCLVLEQKNFVIKLFSAIKQVKIEFPEKPNSVASVVEPIKTIYEMLTPQFKELPLQPTTGIYNSLFDKKQDLPWILPQALQILKREDLETLHDYMVAPSGDGNMYTMYISDTNVYMISQYSVAEINQVFPKELKYTVSHGYWDDTSFTGYDVSMISGVNICKFSLTKREKALQNISSQLSFFKAAKYYNTNIIENASILLKTNNGVIFAPIKANYMNNRTYIYTPVDKISIHFYVNTVKCSYNMYQISSGANKQVFTGSTQYPFRNIIPININHRHVIGEYPENVLVEFRWENNSFVPHNISKQNESTPPEEAKEIWEFINNWFYLPKTT